MEESKSNEMGVIGAILMNNDSMEPIMKILQPEDFQDRKNRAIYETMISLYEDKKVINLITVGDLVRKKKVLGQSWKGIGSYLSGCTILALGITEADIPFATMVKEGAERERIKELGEDVIRMSADVSVRPEDAVENILNSVSSLVDESEEEATLEDKIAEYDRYVEMFQLAKDGGVPGISTGIPGLDRITYGMMPKHVWVIGGTSGYGKSTLSLNLVWQALKKEKTCVIFSNEMGVGQTLAILVGIGKEGSEDYNPTDFIKDAMRNGRLHVYDDKTTVSQISMEMRRLERKGGIDVAVVDYVQNLTGGTKYEVLSDSVNRLQRLAMQYNCTMLLVSQLNKEAQKAGENSFTEGFKGAGELNQAANVAITIGRDRNDDRTYTEDFRIFVDKVRHNQPGMVYCKLVRPGGHIVEMAQNEIQKAIEREIEARKTPTQKKVDSIFEDL